MAPAPHLEAARRLLTRSEGDVTRIVAGGAQRTESVVHGLAALGGEEFVLVHDAARCLTPAVVFERIISSLEAGAEAVIPGLPVTDTIKQVDAGGFVEATPDRARLRAVQTPQGFRVEVLRAAHAQASGRLAATDDAALVEALGVDVLVVQGDARAMKITCASDLDRATRLFIRCASDAAVRALDGLDGSVP